MSVENEGWLGNIDYWDMLDRKPDGPRLRSQILGKEGRYIRIDPSTGRITDITDEYLNDPKRIKYKIYI